MAGFNRPNVRCGRRRNARAHQICGGGEGRRCVIRRSSRRAGAPAGVRRAQRTGLAQRTHQTALPNRTAPSKRPPPNHRTNPKWIRVMSRHHEEAENSPWGVKARGVPPPRRRKNGAPPPPRALVASHTRLSWHAMARPAGRGSAVRVRRRRGARRPPRPKWAVNGTRTCTRTHNNEPPPVPGEPVTQA